MYVCVSFIEQVDSHYCPNCLENLPSLSPEAALKKNRCMLYECLLMFVCISCVHRLGGPWGRLGGSCQAGPGRARLGLEIDLVKQAGPENQQAGLN